MLFGDSFSAGMKIARAGVIAKPGPGGEHFAKPGLCQSAHVGPAPQE